MSRRHKETETDRKKSQQVESHADGHSKGLCFTICSTTLADRLLSLMRRVSSSDSIISKAITSVRRAFEKRDFEIDSKWVKIPRSYFESSIDEDLVDEEPKGRGRPTIKQLFAKISDCEIANYFRRTLSAVKKKCKELYENVTQFAVCFLRGSNQAFTPDDDPYGKLSHYHRVLSDIFIDVPSRKTLSNHLNWFVNWRPVAIGEESPKDKRESFRHRLWERLIDWICNYLTKIAPEYAFVKI